MHDHLDSRNLLSGTRPRCAAVEVQHSDRRYGNRVLQLNLVLTGNERDGGLTAQVLHVGVFSFVHACISGCFLR